MLVLRGRSLHSLHRDHPPGPLEKLRRPGMNLLLACPPRVQPLDLSCQPFLFIPDIRCRLGGANRVMSSLLLSVSGYRKQSSC